MTITKETLAGNREPVIEEESFHLREETREARDKNRKKNKKPDFKQDPWNGEITSTHALKHEFV